ncbi:MAG: hypothetical protein II776_01825 [Clostridia bacterium]|nr:hypothetical protein [Clostridia bacterium]
MENAVDLLQKKAAALGRLPVKTDFSPEEVARIKAALGPWPRALEAAGLKEPKEKSSLMKNREKRKKKERMHRRENQKKREEEA